MHAEVHRLIVPLTSSVLVVRYVRGARSRWWRGHITGPWQQSGMTPSPVLVFGTFTSYPCTATSGPAVAGNGVARSRHPNSSAQAFPVRVNKDRMLKSSKAPSILFLIKKTGVTIQESK